MNQEVGLGGDVVENLGKIETEMRKVNLNKRKVMKIKMKKEMLKKRKKGKNLKKRRKAKDAVDMSVRADPVVGVGGIENKFLL